MQLGQIDKSQGKKGVETSRTALPRRVEIAVGENPPKKAREISRKKQVNGTNAHELTGEESKWG